MDVAAGSTDVPFSKKRLNPLRIFWGLLFSLLLWTSSLSHAAVGDQPIHFSGDKQIWDRKANHIELIGHAAVIQQEETLTADVIHLDLNTRLLDARGNCIYIAKDALIWGEEMHFNIDTHSGTVINGRISSEKFTLRGEMIHKLGPGRFQTHDGIYTTCRDCGATWALEAQDVDMEVEGYAYFSNVVARIKDAPAVWLPYLIMPMKTHRQSGLLFRGFSLGGTNGLMFVLPYFWAINRSSDMTFGLGDYTSRGLRLEWEGRYVLSPRSTGKANFNYINDRTFSSRSDRWSIDLSQTHELPYSIDAKLRLSEVSDNYYPFLFNTDLQGVYGEAFLPSTLSFSRGTPDWSTAVEFQRYRNLLNTLPGDSTTQLLQTDPRTVQLLPSARLTSNTHRLLGTPFFGGVSLGFSNFTRAAGPFDYDTSSVANGTAPSNPSLAYIPGVDPIRKATRLMIVPSVYTAFRVADVVSVVPSLKYQAYSYNFNGQLSTLNRGYLLFQTDLSTQLERIYDLPDDVEHPDAPKYPKMKHVIRPTLTYSLIPLITEDASHPFLQQINTSGYNFDDSDIIPRTNVSQNGANYFYPLGNSLAFGFTTQWIRRKGDFDSPGKSYQTIVELSAGEALNFMLPTNAPAFFTRFYSLLNVNLDHFQSQTTYYYYTTLPSVSSGSLLSPHTLTTNLTYIFDRSSHQRIYSFDRSFGLGYTFNTLTGQTSNLSGNVNFSINDYWMPYGGINYGFLPYGQWFGPSAGLKLQSPSQCWLLTTSIGYNPAAGVSVGFDLALNLSGSGFGGLMEVTNAVQTLSQ